MFKRLIKLLAPMSPRANHAQVPQTRPVLVWTTSMGMVANDTSLDQTVVDLNVFSEVKLEESTTIEEIEVNNVTTNKEKRVSFSDPVSSIIPTENKSLSSDHNSSPPRTKSSTSSKACRYCFETNGDLISPCKCSGSQSFVHIDCMREWIQRSSQVNCGICRASVEGFKSRKHCLYYSAEAFIAVGVLLLVTFYFGSNIFIRNCSRILSNGTKCSPILISIAVILHMASPLLLFVIFWLSTFLIRFKVMVTVYDSNKDKPVPDCSLKSGCHDQEKNDRENVTC